MNHMTTLESLESSFFLTYYIYFYPFILIIRIVDKFPVFPFLILMHSYTKDPDPQVEMWQIRNPDLKGQCIKKIRDILRCFGLG